MNYKNRIIKLRNLLKKEKLDAVLVSSLANIVYLSGYSGFSIEERDAFILITKNSQYLFTNALYHEAVANQVKHLTIADKLFSKFIKTIIKNEKIASIGIEAENLTVAEFQNIDSLINKTTKMVPCEISTIREIKDDEEIANIQKACEIGDQTFEYILKKIKPGITELKLAWEMEKFIREHGGTLSFPTIVAFGANSSVPHHETGDKRLSDSAAKGQAVLLDFGVKVGNYCSDMTRTVFLGKANAEQKKMYEAVRMAQEKAIKLLEKNYKSLIINPKSKGLTCHDLDAAARNYIEQKGFASIPHSVGHGIGLEVHELPHVSPEIKRKVEPGIVFSVEPGIYIPGQGGVRIEDLVAIRENTIELLTNAPKKLIEL